MVFETVREPPMEDLCGLTFELSGPLRWMAGPAWCSITERTTQALTAAVAGPLERGVRPERDWVNSVR